MKAWKEFICRTMGDSWGNENSWPYQPLYGCQFYQFAGDTATLSVKVMATGPVKAYDRIFSGGSQSR